ncbi:hypothetical protein MJ579_06650 [Klebsiella pneumoniae]|nr:hypothetical protein MJ579_06650 [Klebsiella pneumoniae]
MLNGLKPYPFPTLGMVLGEGNRSATYRYMQRCVIMFIPTMAARRASMPSAGARSVSNWASRRSACYADYQTLFREAQRPDGIESIHRLHEQYPFRHHPAALEGQDSRYLRKPRCSEEAPRAGGSQAKTGTSVVASPTAMPAIE